MSVFPGVYGRTGRSTSPPNPWGTHSPQDRPRTECRYVSTNETASSRINPIHMNRRPSRQFN